METLEGKSVLVTGGAKRIGRAIALALAREGARVLIHYNGSADTARRTALECGGARILQADLTRVAEISHMFGEIEHLDGLVNNAARFTRVDPLEVTEAQWDEIHDVNLKAVFFCSQAAARIMLRSGGGRIVNISSLGGIRPWAHHAHYCASKAAVIHLTRALAKAWAPEISVNSVAPGVIPFGDDVNEERISRLVRRTPAARPGTAEEVADAVVSLLKISKFVTGQTLAVDGGLSQT
jgi:3-oxoacyl-[acyl-carrier protein] reductase/pteridine reductase